MRYEPESQPWRDKPVIVYNRQDETGTGFWDPLIGMLGSWCDEDDFCVVNEFKQILPTVEREMTKSAQTAGSC